MINDFVQILEVMFLFKRTFSNIEIIPWISLFL